jgi:hypothetical protein
VESESILNLGVRLEVSSHFNDPAALSPGKGARYTLYGGRWEGLVDSWAGLEAVAKRRNFLSCPSRESNPGHCTDWATPAACPQLAHSLFYVCPKSLVSVILHINVKREVVPVLN